jgi:hypothetical protein
MNLNTVNYAKKKKCVQIVLTFYIVFKPEESRPARALAYAPTLRTEDLKPHRYRHMLRGSAEGTNSNRSSIDEDEKATDEVTVFIKAEINIPT